MSLSEHFDLEEFIVSQTATRQGIDNTPNDDVIDNLKFLCSTLEQIRSLLGMPITITSGYRSPKLNTAIGSSSKSQHTQGLAADFICPKFGSPYEVAMEIKKSGIVVDQLIYEGGWVHVSITETPRQQYLTARFKPTRYEQGINK